MAAPPTAVRYILAGRGMPDQIAFRFIWEPVCDALVRRA